MLPPPTTIATSTPLACTAATSLAIAATRSGSVPYCSSPISASPESLSSTRPKAGAAESVTTGASVANPEPGKAPDHDVLARLGGQRGAELLDRLATVLFLVDVLLAQQHNVVQPLVELALDDSLPHVLRLVGRLLGGDPLLAL